MSTPGMGTVCVWVADQRQVGNNLYGAGQQYPAMQIRVVAGTNVNLLVFSDEGPPFIVLNVPEDDTQVAQNSWTYPPGSF